MTTCFVCDRCQKVMKYEEDRYYLRGHTDQYGAPLDFCPRCVESLQDFIKEREEEDMDSTRFKRLRK